MIKRSALIEYAASVKLILGVPSRGKGIVVVIGVETIAGGGSSATAAKRVGGSAAKVKTAT